MIAMVFRNRGRAKRRRASERVTVYFRIFYFQEMDYFHQLTGGLAVFRGLLIGWRVVFRSQRWRGQRAIGGAGGCL